MLGASPILFLSCTTTLPCQNYRSQILNKKVEGRGVEVTGLEYTIGAEKYLEITDAKFYILCTYQLV